MKYILVILLIIAGLSSCKKKKKNEDDEKSSFEKTTLLENVAQHSVIAGYEALQSKLSTFELAYANFIANQTVENFEATRIAWKDAYLQWQNVLVFELGPGMDKLLQASVGSFPSDTNKISANATSGTYDLTLVSNLTAQGLPAFDYLFYRTNARSYFGVASYSKYGTDLIQKMKGDISEVLMQWKNSYATSFAASTGTESTSAFSVFVNQYVKSYEQTKWTKVGIPIGKQSLGVAKPDYIEARKSEIALNLLLENIRASHRLFNGNRMTGESGIGFDDYLEALDRKDLVTSINASFTEIITDITAISATFENTLTSNPQALDAIYTKLHNLTVSLKTDMTAAFGVLITYQDNDGD